MDLARLGLPQAIDLLYIFIQDVLSKYLQRVSCDRTDTIVTQFQRERTTLDLSHSSKVAIERQASDNAGALATLAFWFCFKTRHTFPFLSRTVNYQHVLVTKSLRKVAVA